MTAKPTVLIADDSASLRAQMQDRLVQEGYQVLLAENGREALAAIREQKPDAAFLDVHMPELDGYGVCEKLVDLNIKLPIVLLTSVQCNAAKMLGEQWGGYLVKPVGDEPLLRTLRGVLAIPVETL